VLIYFLNRGKPAELFEHNGVKITWLGHDGFKIQEGSETLVIDPFKLKSAQKADYLLISHEHFDHCNPEDLNKVVKEGTKIVASKDCKEALSQVSPKGEVKYVKPGDSVKLGNFEVRAVPAYNVNKFREPGKPFHPKADDKVGYVIRTKSGVSIYHTGDTDSIPEMSDLRPDIALIPVSGTYVMTVDEALEATGRIKPKIAIPMHWGTIVGSKDNAEQFKKEAKVRVEILEVEG
jgi:L-ascorbate metabolism protein UlaG (beta-lactamase superfamily)